MINSHKWLLQESETKLPHDRFIALINSLKEGFIAVNAKGLIELSNSAAMELLDANVLKGKTLFESVIFHNQDGSQVDLNSLLKGLNTTLVNQDWLLKHHDGSMHRVYANISPVKAYDGMSQGGYVILLRGL